MSRILLRGVCGHVGVIFIFFCALPISLKLSVEDVHLMPFSNSVFHENRCCESHNFPYGLLPSYRCPLYLVGEPEYCENRCNESPSLFICHSGIQWTDSYEISYYGNLR